MQTTVTKLESMGGLYEAEATVHAPRNVDELVAVFQNAEKTGRKLTVMGGRRSFGEQFLPPTGCDVVDTTEIQGPVRFMESEPDGSLWVAVPARLTFEQLCNEVRGHVPWFPPTGDRITVAGALAACSHSAVGYFAGDIRAFTLVTPTGQQLRCDRSSTGLEGELFRAVPGAYGALGVVTEVEIRLRRVMANQRAEITVLEREPVPARRAVDRLESLFQANEYALGRGLFFYGTTGPCVLFADRLVDVTKVRPAADLPLADNATTRNIVLQGLANRFPRLFHKPQSLLLQKNRRFLAPLYAFTFYQRSYDRARDLLGADALLPSVLRAVGVDPRLTVCHQTFVIPPNNVHAFLEMYFGKLKQSPEVNARLELQDMVRLPDCPWPLHAAFSMKEGSFFFTCSFSVRRDAPSFDAVRNFLSEISTRGFRELGVKVLLLKHVHCAPELLREMHQPFIDTLQPLRSKVDPKGLLTSRLLETLFAR